MSEPIDIGTLFADMLPDPMKAQRDEGVRLSNLVSGGGSAAAYYAPQREATLRNALGGMFGVDTRTGSEKLREAMKGVDPNNPEDLIRLASMADAIDPVKAVQIRQSAAQLTKQQRDEKEDRERKSVEQQQADTAFAMNRAVALEALTSDVTAREEVGQQRAANATLVDNSTVLSEAEQTNYKALINSGAFDGKQADLLKVTNPSPLIFGNNAIVKDKDGNWTSIVSTPTDRKASGLEAIARLSFDATDPKLTPVIAAIQAGEITTMTQLNSLIPEKPERADISKTVEDAYKDSAEISRSAFASNMRIDDLLKTIEEENLLNYTTGGVFTTVRSGTLKALGERDEIEFLRTAYIRERNTEIVNSLPKGTASDRDIAIFSAGFPAEDATIQEVYDYLQATKRINNLNQEYNDLLGMYISTQADQGLSPTTVGFDAEFRKYVSASKLLKEKVTAVQALQNPTEQDIANIEASLSVFEDNYGKLPIDLIMQ
jgi:hypothetical protein